MTTWDRVRLVCLVCFPTLSVSDWFHPPLISLFVHLVYIPFFSCQVFCIDSSLSVSAPECSPCFLFWILLCDFGLLFSLFVWTLEFVCFFFTWKLHPPFVCLLSISKSIFCSSAHVFAVSGSPFTELWQKENRKGGKTDEDRKWSHRTKGGGKNNKMKPENPNYDTDKS